MTPGPLARARSLGVRLKSPGVCSASITSWPCDSVSDLCSLPMNEKVGFDSEVSLLVCLAVILFSSHLYVQATPLS